MILTADMCTQIEDGMTLAFNLISFIGFCSIIVF